MSAPHGSIAAMTTERRRPPHTADERTMLESWLDFYRTTLVLKAEGLEDEQLRTASVPPSPLTLQGLVQHLAEVERAWFQRILLGKDVPSIYGRSGDGHDEGFALSEDTSFADARARWETEVAVARKNCAQHSLDDTVPYPFVPGDVVSLRWIYQHMIAEYARHCGHADLIRERLDGATGV